jgi:hypothetical protein
MSTFTHFRIGLNYCRCAVPLSCGTIDMPERDLDATFSMIYDPTSYLLPILVPPFTLKRFEGDRLFRFSAMRTRDDGTDAEKPDCYVYQSQGGAYWLSDTVIADEQPLLYIDPYTHEYVFGHSEQWYRFLIVCLGLAPNPTPRMLTMFRLRYDSAERAAALTTLACDYDQNWYGPITGWVENPNFPPYVYHTRYIDCELMNFPLYTFTETPFGQIYRIRRDMGVGFNGHTITVAVT